MRPPRPTPGELDYDDVPSTGENVLSSLTRLESAVHGLNMEMKRIDGRVEGAVTDISELKTTENKRAGATKTVLWLVGAFGSIGVAGTLWMVSQVAAAPADDARRDGRIERIEREQHSHVELPGHPSVTRDVSNLQRDVAVIETRTKRIEEVQAEAREESRQNAREILERLRRR